MAGFFSKKQYATIADKELNTSNTGLGKIYDCPGWGTGDGKMCMCENTNPCTQIPC